MGCKSEGGDEIEGDSRGDADAWAAWLRSLEDVLAARPVPLSDDQMKALRDIAKHD